MYFVLVVSSNASSCYLFSRGFSKDVLFIVLLENECCRNCTILFFSLFMSFILTVVILLIKCVWAHMVLENS